MLISDPPVQINRNLWMLGSNEYPLYFVESEGERAIFEGGVGSMGPLVLEQMDDFVVIEASVRGGGVGSIGPPAVEQIEAGIDRASIRQLVIPHAHPDHVMAVPLLRETLPALTVVASEPAAAALANEKAISFFLKIDGALTASLLEKGVIGESHRPKPLAEKTIPVDRVVHEGDTIAVGALAFHVLQTPGHSDCSLSFHEPDRAVLFVSDAAGYYMPDHDAWWPDYFSGYRAYLESLERLAALGAEVLCLGHRGVVTGADAVRSHFVRALAAARQYHERIVGEIKSGKPARQLAEELGSEVYDKTPLLPLDFFQKNCGLLVKQSLRHEGIPLDE
jgi:glyoxylase-like metal-dependent hydrolase (beta-lactamase superfamily II)